MNPCNGGCVWLQERSRIPILRSAGRVARYHLGSMALGSFVIAVCQLLRALLEYLDRQTRQAQEANAVTLCGGGCTPM